MTFFNTEIADVTSKTSTFYSSEVNLGTSTGFAVWHSVTDTTTGADTFTDTDVGIAGDTITLTAHGLATGAVGQLTSTGTLPAGLSLATDYYVIVVDADTIQLATSLANAQAGTQVDITDAGTVAATNTFTPTALSGTVTYQASVDGENWEDLASPAANAFTGAETSLVNQADAYYGYMRLEIAITSGMCSFEAHASGL